MNRTVGVDIHLFNVTCLNGTDYLEEVVNLTVVDIWEKNGNFSEVAIFLQEDLTLNISGQFFSINNTDLEIDVGNSIVSGSDTVTVTVIPGSYGDQGKKLANNDETVVVLLEDTIVDYNVPRDPGNTPVSISWVSDIDTQLTLVL